MQREPWGGGESVCRGVVERCLGCRGRACDLAANGMKREETDLQTHRAVGSYGVTVCTDTAQRPDMPDSTGFLARSGASQTPPRQGTIEHLGRVHGRAPLARVQRYLISTTRACPFRTGITSDDRVVRAVSQRVTVLTFSTGLSRRSIRKIEIFTDHTGTDANRYGLVGSAGRVRVRARVRDGIGCMRLGPGMIRMPHEAGTHLYHVHCCCIQRRLLREGGHPV
jgi:hypothetical protein